jgi:tRNA A37 threonylcarbamoyltransferase TsaD
MCGSVLSATAHQVHPCLLVSGGHNLLVLVKGVGSYVQLGTTLDDALGKLCPRFDGRFDGRFDASVRCTAV